MKALFPLVSLVFLTTITVRADEAPQYPVHCLLGVMNGESDFDRSSALTIDLKKEELSKSISLQIKMKKEGFSSKPVLLLEDRDHQNQTQEGLKIVPKSGMTFMLERYASSAATNEVGGRAAGLSYALSKINGDNIQSNTLVMVMDGKEFIFFYSHMIEVETIKNVIEHKDTINLRQQKVAIARRVKALMVVECTVQNVPAPAP